MFDNSSEVVHMVKAPSRRQLLAAGQQALAAARHAATSPTALLVHDAFLAKKAMQDTDEADRVPAFFPAADYETVSLNAGVKYAQQPQPVMTTRLTTTVGQVSAC